MRIAVLGHIRHPIARPFAGGMEAHCWHLVHALAARGHDVTLFAAGDSEVGVELHPVIPRHYDGEMPWAEWRGTARFDAFQDRAFAGVLPELEGFDVVHNNCLHRYPPRLARRDRLAMVTSLHVPPFAPLDRAVRGATAPWARVAAPSERQRRAWWPEGAPEAAHVVPNGIDPAAWPFAERGGAGAIWSGRIAPNKAPHLAIAAARAAAMPLTLFGAVEDRAYYEDRIKPCLGGEIRHAGHLSGADLVAGMGRGDVFLFTPDWDEPFGLAAVEAMACGLPVAATDRGAVREVVGAAGVVAEPDPQALAHALVAAREIPRKVPRARVERLFTLERMVTGYERLYDLARAARGAAAPDIAFREIELPGRTGSETGVGIA